MEWLLGWLIAGGVWLALEIKRAPIVEEYTDRLTIHSADGTRTLKIATHGPHLLVSLCTHGEFYAWVVPRHKPFEMAVALSRWRRNWELSLDQEDVRFVTRNIHGHFIFPGEEELKT